MDPTYLRRAQSTSVSGIFFRHIPAGGDPMFRAEHPADGRWQRGAMVEGFYLARSKQTAWSEWYRALAELAIPPMRQMPRGLWRFKVRIEGVADLSTSDKLEEVGLPLPVPVRSQWPLFQAAGEALAKEGWPGVLYPSASRIDYSESGYALCLFRSTFRISGVEPIGSPTRYNEPPPPPRSLRT